MPLLDKPNKRRCYPVSGLPDERKVYVRSMKSGEIKRMEALAAQHKTAFAMGICLANEDGSPETEKLPDETDVEFSERVSIALDAADVDTETINQISQAIGKIGRVDVETIQKN